MSGDASVHEHPIEQKIEHVMVDSMLSFAVGNDGVTRIEACTKSGLHADMPYIRVWRGDVCAGEFCQHNMLAVMFSPEPREG